MKKYQVKVGSTVLFESDDFNVAWAYYGNIKSTYKYAEFIDNESENN